MADRIKLLPEIVANQIKAGEVVESPSSAVKEMMENAIDAGASTVQVNFTNGGRDMIQIVDDGCGMSPTDARMAFECHATSKIATLDDIYALHTFGFRGEALASIAAVAQVELITRQEDAEFGTKTIINGGEFVSQQPVAAPVGSQFIVRNLFYNTPARRKFIDNKESKLTAAIKTEFRRVALCHPEVALELQSAGAPLYMLPQSNLAERIIGIMGKQMKSNLLEVGIETSIVKIDGYIGRPSAARAHGAEQYMFVNGRYFRSPYLNKAVTKAYEKLIPDGASPSFFIYLTVDAERVDVNVHAKKTEVKFAEQDAIWQIINAAVRETLAKTGAVPLLDFDNESDIEIPVARQGVYYNEPRATTRNDYNPFAIDNEENNTSSSTSRSVFDVNHDFETSNAYDDFEFPLSGTIGGSTSSEFEYIESHESGEQYLELESQADAEWAGITHIGGRYASLTAGGQLIIADLMRARERVLFDGYMTMLGGGKSVSQQLLFAERLELSDEEYALLEEYATDFAALGFDIEMCGNRAIDVRGIPADSTAERIDIALYELLKTVSLAQPIAEIRKERMAMTLAHNEASHKSSYTQSDAEHILGALENASDRNYSPSGKQILSEMTINEIQKRLG